MRQVLYTSLLNGDMSQATLTSNPITLFQDVLGAVQAVFTGSPVGTLKLQASNDGVTYTDVANSSSAVSAAGNVMWDIADIGYNYLQCVYTKTSGTGSLTVTINAKGP